MPFKNLLSLSNLTLLVALALSTVAAYYSIIGLTAIFAGAVIPVIVMGSILEVGKITTTVWLRKYWDRCGWMLKLYLVPAVVALAFLTSMGIFGFLSKAHSDQGMVSGDVQAKVSIFDEKIKTAKENIDANRKALKQLDEAVDQVMARSTDEKGADKSVAIRRSQSKERTRLLQDIEAEQKKIAQLNEERAPIAAEVRKVEAEVGPIKYIAAFIYGDNPDSNLLERAVRWVIILLVIVFDPLAIALVLAANSSKEWDKKVNDDIAAMNINPEPEGVVIREFTEEEIKAMDEVNKPVEEPWPTEWTEVKVEDEPVKELSPEPVVEPAYLKQGFKYPENFERQKPLVAAPEKKEEKKKKTKPKAKIIINADPSVEKIEKKFAMVRALTKKSEPEIKQEPEIKVEEKIEEKVEEIKEPTADSTDIITEGVTKELPFEVLDEEWVRYEGKLMQRQILQKKKPELFAVPDSANSVKTGFGIKFPAISNRGDIFVRVDVLPNRVFKFDGSKWIETQKENSGTYLDNTDYVQFLINKIYSGEYDIESLTEDERNQIENFLKPKTLDT